VKKESTRDAVVVLGEVVVLGVLAFMLARSNLAGTTAGVVIGLTFAPLALARPRWALLAFVAIPPGLLTVLSRTALSTLMMLIVIIALAVIGFFLGPRRAGDGPLAAGYGALLALMATSYLSSRVPDAVGISLQLITYLSYAALYIIVVNVAPQDAVEGRAFVRALHAAVLVSVLATGAIALTQMGGFIRSGFSEEVFPEQPGLLYNRTHFGYLMAMGLAVSLPRWALRVGRTGLWGALSIACYILVVLSFTRGGWAAALLMTLLVSFTTRRRRFLLVVPAGIALFSVPAIRERLLSDFAGGLLFAIRSGAAGSQRVLLWQFLLPLALSAPLTGHGFGFMTTLSPELSFGTGQFVTAQNPLLYAHNDFLYLLLELGFLGLGLYVAGLFGWWSRVVTSLKGELGRKNPERLALTLTCVGAGMVTLVAQLADNAFSIPAVYDRFAVVAASAWVLRSLPVFGAAVPGGPEAA
jgi:O-antigen ligase